MMKLPQNQEKEVRRGSSSTLCSCKSLCETASNEGRGRQRSADAWTMARCSRVTSSSSPLRLATIIPSPIIILYMTTCIVPSDKSCRFTHQFFIYTSLYSKEKCGNTHTFLTYTSVLAKQKNAVQYGKRLVPNSPFETNNYSTACSHIHPQCRPLGLSVHAIPLHHPYAKHLKMPMFFNNWRTWLEEGSVPFLLMFLYFYQKLKST